MKKSQKRKLSALLLLIFILLVVSVILILNDRNLLSTRNRIYTIADNVAGLKAKGVVMIKGMEVGQVKDINFIEDGSARLIVLMTIDKEVNIPLGSSAKISEFEGLKCVEIETVSSDIFLNDNDTIKFVKGFDITNDDELQPLKEKTEEMLESIDTLVQMTELLSQYNTEMAEAIDSNNGIVYRIQILTSSKDISLNDKRFVGLTDVWKYFHNGVYKYTAGLSADYEASLIMRDEMNKYGYPQAFIVAFKDGERISR